MGEQLQYFHAAAMWPSVVLCASLQHCVFRRQHISQQGAPQYSCWNVVTGACLHDASSALAASFRLQKG